MIYLVSYDLNTPGKDYQRLIDAICSYENPCRVLKSQWLIRSDKPAEQICKELLAFVDANDELLICEVNENRFGRLNTHTREQLQKIQSRIAIKGLLGDLPRQ